MSCGLSLLLQGAQFPAGAMLSAQCPADASLRRNKQLPVGAMPMAQLITVEVAVMP